MEKKSSCVCIEYCRGQQTKRWSMSGPTKQIVQEDIQESSSSPLLGRLLRGFMPEGYPDSVTPDYLGFQVWDSIQALMSYVRGMLCSQAIMTGIGVGEQAATPLAAVFQFFVRDLAGMLGGVVFAFVQGSDLDIYAKQWRLFADCVNNVGYIADLLSPVFPDAFLLLACIGSLSRAITGVAGGATRAALTQHFARTGNAADIAAKEGSQETATTLIGMILGMFVLRIAAGHDLLIWSIFLLLSFMHIYANIKAARSLQLTSLNPARLDILLAHYLATQERSVLRPKHVAALEPLLPPRVTGLWQRLILRAPRMEVRMGARMSDQKEGVQEQLAAMGSDKKHIVALERERSCASVVLRVDCTADDVLDAYVHAYMVFHAKQPQEQSLKAATMWMEKAWPKLKRELSEAGWSLKGASLCPSPWRAAWGSQLPSHSHVD